MKLQPQLSALLLCAAGVACAPMPSEGWLKPMIAPHLRYARGQTTDAFDVWRGGGFALRLAYPEAAEEIGKQTQDDALVMVSMRRDSSLALELRDDSRTLGWFPGDRDTSTYALVRIADGLMLDGLAAAAHGANGHACGNITALNLKTLAVPADDLIPPLLPEAVALDAVKALIAQTDAARIEANVKALEAMGLRHHRSDIGQTVPDKVIELFRAAGDLEGAAGASIELVEHGENPTRLLTTQKSVVVSFPGQEDDGTTVVIGAHLDSINKDDYYAKANLQAPGADDDASGVATLVEVARVIAASGAQFRRRVELHAYAAEEVGLVGSADISERYRVAGRKVAAMFQIDMNSWSRDPAKQTIHIVATDTHINLRRGLKDLLHSYLGGDFLEKTLSAGTSDHKSWANAGYPTVFPFEDPDDYNKALHSTTDTTTTENNFTLSGRFAQLALAYLAHSAGLVGGDATEALAGLRQALPADLKVAIRANVSGPTSFDVFVAAPESVARVELCKIDAAGSIACPHRRVSGAPSRVSGGRAFFAPLEPLSLGDAVRLAVFGYDATDRLVAYRTLLLAQR